MTNSQLKYKTQEHFRDILGDLDNDSQTAIVIMQAFEGAIIDWMKYHEDHVKKYRDLHRRFLTADVQ